jgi:hypothetical protein
VIFESIKFTELGSTCSFAPSKAVGFPSDVKGEFYALRCCISSSIQVNFVLLMVGVLAIVTYAIGPMLAINVHVLRFEIVLIE